MTTHPTDGGDKGVVLRLAERMCRRRDTGWPVDDTVVTLAREVIRLTEHAERMSKLATPAQFTVEENERLRAELHRLRSLAALAESKAGECVEWPEVMSLDVREAAILANAEHALAYETDKMPRSERIYKAMRAAHVKAVVKPVVEKSGF